MSHPLDEVKDTPWGRRVTDQIDMIQQQMKESPMGEKWTLESLYKHFSELRVTDIDRLKERFETQNKQVEVVATSVAARFLQGNEFRAALEDAAKLAARTLMPRTEAESKFASLESKIDAIGREDIATNKALEKQFSDRIEGYAKRIEEIERRLNIGEGSEHGSAAMRKANIEAAAASAARLAMIVGAVAAIVGGVIGHFWK